MRAHITTAVHGGEVYYAESSSGEVLGVAVWFGPSQQFLDTCVYLIVFLQVSRINRVYP